MTNNSNINIINKPTITLAISALNEENNILAFLQSVLEQKEDGFILEKILVVSDGSTDKTVELVKSLNSTKIEIMERRVRAGKAQRLNEVYASLKSDILVQSDADIVFAHPLVIRNLIYPLINEEKVGMCGGNPIPMEAETFTERAIFCTTIAYAELRKIKNIFSADGKLLAFKKEFIKKITIPDTLADDAYVYFASIMAGYEYRFVESAVVNYRLPRTLRDHIMQNTRFIAIHSSMDRYFQKDIVENEYRLPTFLKQKLMARQFLAHPILSAYIFLINRFCKLRSIFLMQVQSSKWSAAKSTKTLRPL